MHIEEQYRVTQITEETASYTWPKGGWEADIDLVGFMPKQEMEGAVGQ